MIRLGVNIDHVATLRNARDEAYPSPVHAAKECEIAGADNITCHLRQDRRHIRDGDVFRIKEAISIPMNFEMGATDEMVAIALKLLPQKVCLVPEKREERTTEGGLALTDSAKIDDLRAKTEVLRSSGISVSFFVEPKISDIETSHRCGATAVELHTGAFCHRFLNLPNHHSKLTELAPFIEAAQCAHSLGLEVHIGHGINYANANYMQLVPWCEEANIGHAIVAQSLFTGMRQAVQDMKRLINNPSLRPDFS